MVESYTYTLIWSLLTIAFILVGSLSLGQLARLFVRLRKGSRRRQEDAFAGYAFAAPWIIGFVIFVLLPVAASIYWSLTRYRLPNPPEWIGLPELHPAC